MNTGEIVAQVIGVVNIVISAVIGLVVQSMNTKTSKIDTLESNLKTATHDLIEEKLGALREKHQDELKNQNDQISRILDRLDKGDERFNRLEQKDHELQVTVLQELRKLQEVVATKDDLDRLRKELAND